MHNVLEERVGIAGAESASMGEFLSSPWVSLVMLLTVSAVLVAVGVYVIGKVRSGPQDGEPSANEWLTNFKEIHAQGELTDQEFRTIKALLAERLQRELKDAEESSKSQPN